MKYVLAALAFSLFSGTSYAAPACPDLHLNGHWKTDAGTFFFRSYKTYQIQQQGCFVLVYDEYRKATWKIDLSGDHVITAPQETVKTNFDADGQSAADNISNVVVNLKPRGTASNYFGADLSSTVELAEQKSFPISLRARFGAQLNIMDNSACPVCSSGPTNSIEIRLTEVVIEDMSRGVPQGVDKASFLSGINTALSVFLNAFGYKMNVLVLIKD